MLVCCVRALLGFLGNLGSELDNDDNDDHELVNDVGTHIKCSKHDCGNHSYHDCRKG